MRAAEWIAILLVLSSTRSATYASVTLGKSSTPSCNAVWNTNACDGNECYTCGARIQYLVSTGLSQGDAENQVASEFPSECGACAAACTCADVADVMACNGDECYTCGARISYLVSTGYSQADAENRVAIEFPSECGACSNGGTGEPDSPFDTKSLVLTNKCPYTVWPGLNGRIPSTGDYFFGPAGSANPAGFELPAGTSATIAIPDGIASFTTWPRTGCAFQSDGRFICETGECGNDSNKWDGTCFQSGPEGGTSLAEATVAANGGGAFYDLSLVDGYTLPIGINVHHGVDQVGVPDEFNCKDPRCDPDLTFAGCPPESRKSVNGRIVGCNNIHKAISDPDAIAAYPILQTYFDNNDTRSHTECSCLVGSCAGGTTEELLQNLRNGNTLGVDLTGYCCSPLNPLYSSPKEVARHICSADDKPLPLNCFGGGLRYDQIFKEMCPQAYSWQFDDAASTYQCSGQNLTLEIVFC